MWEKYSMMEVTLDPYQDVNGMELAMIFLSLWAKQFAEERGCATS